MFKIVTLPFDDDMEEFDQNRLDRVMYLLKEFEIKNYKPELVQIDGQYYWTIFIEYEKKVEFKQNSNFQNQNQNESFQNQSLQSQNLQNKKSLPEEELKTRYEKELYAVLKEWRTEQAMDLGYPPYIVASNKLLVDIVKTRPKNSQELSKIKGMGAKKTKEYGREILLILENFFEANDK